jgi:hypothetical protein
MQKWSSKKKQPRDVNYLAALIVSQETGEDTPKPKDSDKNPANPFDGSGSTYWI